MYSQSHCRFFLGICVRVQSLDAEQLRNNQGTYYRCQDEVMVTLSSPKRCICRQAFGEGHHCMRHLYLHEVSVCSRLGRLCQQDISAEGRYTTQSLHAFLTDFSLV